MSRLLKALEKELNYTTTENGAITYKSTLNPCLDYFGMAGSFRTRDYIDKMLIFGKAFEHEPLTALKLLFYMRDIRGGQGERELFRDTIAFLSTHYPQTVAKNIHLIPEYGRWDDLYALVGTPVEGEVFDLIKNQLLLDLNSTTPSLLGKWLKSENTSSRKSRQLGALTRKRLGLTPKQYRVALSSLRTKINIVEKLMSANEWDKIEFDKIPSKAGLKYKNAFARRDMLRYKEFALNEDTKVNAGAIYPYEVVEQALDCLGPYWRPNRVDDVQRAMLSKYWNNLPNYLEGTNKSMLAMVDTSGSMNGTPINVAISLGMYMGERLNGPFHNHYMSFSNRPQLIKIEGNDFVDKVYNIYKTNLISNTNIEAAFELILDTAKSSRLLQEDLPETLIVISDMEFDRAVSPQDRRQKATLIELMTDKYRRAGYKMPNLIFWNVNARQNNIPAIGDGISYVSGFSPTIFEQIVTGKTGLDLMYQVVNSERYSAITL